MSDILDKLRAFYENAETDECLYDIRRAIEELERLYALPVFDGPPTWQEEVASVEEAFERSGVKPTWPDDEPGNIGPMAAAMADEIGRLRVAIRRLADQDATLSVQGGSVTVTMDATLTVEEREAVAWAALAFGNKAEELGRQDDLWLRLCRQDDLWLRLLKAELTLRNLLARLS
jgi:hypothetical protein